MHSSRMRNICCSGRLRGCLPGGSVCPGGMSAQGGCLADIPLVNRMLVKTLLCRNYLADGNHYHPQRSCGKVMFLNLCVILCTEGSPYGKERAVRILLELPFLVWVRVLTSCSSGCNLLILRLVLPEGM